jgi:hypothetical protein
MFRETRGEVQALDTDDKGEGIFFCQICCEENTISMATLYAGNKFLFVLRCADLNQNNKWIMLSGLSFC